MKSAHKLSEIMRKILGIFCKSTWIFGNSGITDTFRLMQLLQIGLQIIRNHFEHAAQRCANRSIAILYFMSLSNTHYTIP